MWVGTVDRVQAHPRELVRAALSLGAVAALVAHNHVSATAQPSQEDICFTAKLVNAFAPFDLRLHDHIIVGRDGCYSMRAAGVLKKIEERGRLACAANELAV
jgi:DNA repair protein RadC